MAADGKALLKRAHEARGFHLGVHEIMADSDPDYLEHYQTFLEFADTGSRHLDRKTKEIMHVVADVTLATDVDQVAAHLLAAKDHGASEDELREVCLMMFVLGGATALLRAMEAWRKAFRPDLPRAYDLITTAP